MSRALFHFAARGFRIRVSVSGLGSISLSLWDRVGVRAYRRIHPKLIFVSLNATLHHGTKERKGSSLKPSSPALLPVVEGRKTHLTSLD
jgi:hypothetical protein